VLVTGDSWGFVHQLLNRLSKRGIAVPKIHYVAPQVWAWKRGRAKTVARLVDHLMTLLPNEPPYFTKYALPCTFVGHPVIENTSNINIDSPAFRSRHNIPQNCTLLCVLPGSRQSEIARIAPIFKDIIKGILKHFPDLFVVIPSVETMAARVQASFADCAAPLCVVTGQSERYAAFCASTCAVAASGTVSLELTACGTPHVVAYKFGTVTNVLARLFVRPHLPLVNLINLLQVKEIIPEWILYDCKTNYILPRILDLMHNPDRCAAQIADAQKSLQMLRSADMLPSQKAAEVVIETFAYFEGVARNAPTV
jgi:lipid-A-disaccharide synthase